MVLRDGVRLDADVYRPEGPGPYPVLMLRQAYGRRVASTLCYAHPSWYAAQGYIVVVQDVRGRGTSEGEFRTFEHEACDGAEALAWAAALEGSSGCVGMYGFSYQGMVQLYAAAEPNPALKALAPAMIGWNVREDWAHEGGAFNLAANLGWALQLATDTARRHADREAFDALYPLSRGAPPLQSPNPARPAILKQWEALTHYQTWLDAPADDPYWARVSPASSLDGLVAAETPMLFIGGWFDSHLPGTLAAYHAMASRSVAPVRLSVGPWTHFPWDRNVGELDFGPAAVNGRDELQVRWFDHCLKGRDSGLLDEPPIRLFDMGEDVASGERWRGFQAWPEATLTLHLSGNGRAAQDGAGGSLLAEAPDRPGSEALVHDPWRPAPSFGGAFGSPPGPLDRRLVDARSDVLTFTSEAFTAPTLIAGDVQPELSVLCDSPSFDIGCVLSRVACDGRTYQLSEGYGVFADGVARVGMRPTCATIQPGEALRLSVSLASYPAHPVNPGNGRRAVDADIREAQAVTLLVLTGAGASRLHLGVPLSEAGR